MAPKRKPQKSDSEEECDFSKPPQPQHAFPEKTKFDEIQAELATIRFQLDSLVDSHKISSSLAECSNKVQSLVKDELVKVVEQIERAAEKTSKGLMEMEAAINLKVETAITKQASATTTIQQKVQEVSDLVGNDTLALEERLNV